MEMKKGFGTLYFVCNFLDNSTHLLQQLLTGSTLSKLCGATASKSIDKHLEEKLEGIQSNLTSALHQILRL